MLQNIFSLSRTFLCIKSFMINIVIFSIMVVIILTTKNKLNINVVETNRNLSWGLKDLFYIYLFADVVYYLTMYLAPLFTENTKAYYFIQESFGIILFLTILLYWHWRKINITKLKEIITKSPIKKEGLLRWIIFGLLFISIYVLVAALFHDEDVSYVVIFSRIDSLSGIIKMFLISCIIIPFVEELYFRGLFYNYLRTMVGVNAGVFLVAVLFAIVHGFGIVLVYRIILGLIYGYLFEKTESILVPFLFHGYSNFIILALSVYNGYIFKHFTLVYYVYFMAFTIGIAYTIYLIFFSKKID